jgi:hypothetical protein
MCIWFEDHNNCEDLGSFFNFLLVLFIGFLLVLF